MRVELWLSVMAGSSHPGFASSVVVGKPEPAYRPRLTAEVVVTIRDLRTEQADVLRGLCREHGVGVRRMRFELSSTDPFETASPSRPRHGR